MTGAAILSSLGDIPSGPAELLMFRLERTSETRATLTMEIKTRFGYLRLNTDNPGVARKFIHWTDKVRTDSLIVGDVKYSLRDPLVSGTILPFSSYQIELVLTLDLLFGRSGLIFSRINQESI